MGEYITPPSLPPTTYCRRLLIPNTPEWIGTVTGALMSLIYASEWKQTTGITQEEAADRAREMFNLYLDSGNDGECGEMACCGDKPTLHRINPETGRPEISTDDGTTWTPDPADIQNQIMLLPPPVVSGGASTKCDAATNASSHVNELITATAENLTTASNVFALAVGIAEAVLGLFLILISAGTLTAPVTLVATSIWAAATSLFALGISAYNAYWTTDKKDAILCAIYCNIGANGQFTEAQYQAFRTKIYDTLPSSPALDIVMTSINAGGAKGMSQMASYGNAAEADCSSCDCGEFVRIYPYDGTASSQSWDEETGELTATPAFVDGIYQLWLAYDPAVLLPTTFAAIDNCARFHYDILSGTINLSPYGRLCNSADVVDFSGAVPETTMENTWILRSAVTFTIKAVGATRTPP